MRGAALLVGAWLLAAGAGLGALCAYDATPGRGSSKAADAWPKDAGFARAADRPTLLVFLHPRCPCSEATLGELREIVARRGGALDVRVLFVAPPGAPGDWARTELRRRAEETPGVVVADDVGGAAAARFGAKTSGATFLYDGGGRLVFSGGITAARGHPGDNAGRAAVLAFCAAAPSETSATPVFGCPLLGPEGSR